MRTSSAAAIKVNKRKAIFPLALLLFFWRAGPLCAETLVLTTYYPAPYGGYVSLLTTGRTALARDADLVTIGKAGGQMDKLLVNGNITATNSISAGNVLAGGNPVVTGIECEFPLACTVSGNSIHIGLAFPECVSPGPASAKEAVWASAPAR